MITPITLITPNPKARRWNAYRLCTGSVNARSIVQCKVQMRFFNTALLIPTISDHSETVRPLKRRVRVVFCACCLGVAHLQFSGV